jgi:uncharacterized protein (TIGR03067 family)
LAVNRLIILKDGRYVVVQGRRVTHGVLKLDPTKTPKHYDVFVTEGVAKGLTVFGVYELDGDTFQICLPIGKRPRPASVTSKPGDGCLFQAFKREPQNVKEAMIDAAREDLAGTWQALAYALEGKKASDDDMKKIKLIFDADGRTQAFEDNKLFLAADTKIDPVSIPATIDMTYTQGYLKGKTALGIYQIKDGVLTICRSAPGHKRPDHFDSTPGSGLTLMSYGQKVARP